MDNLDEEIGFVIKRLAKAIRKHGSKKVIAQINNIDNEKPFIETHKNIISFIIRKTAIAFNVNPEEMKKKNTRGLIADARSISVVLIKKHLELSHKSIIEIFGSTNHSLVSRAIKKHSELDINLKRDRKFLEIFNDLDKKVEQQKEILNQKHS